jgi:hypothetical protein
MKSIVQIVRNQILEIVGIATVVLSLMFVAFEIRQSNKIATVSNVNEIYARFTAVNGALMSDPELARLVLKASEAEELSDLTKSEILRYYSWIQFLTNIWLSANIAYDNGQLAEPTYNALFDDASYNLQVTGPAGRRIWKKYINTFPALSDMAIIIFIKSELESYEARGEIADDQ